MSSSSCNLLRKREIDHSKKYRFNALLPILVPYSLSSLSFRDMYESLKSIGHIDGKSCRKCPLNMSFHFSCGDHGSYFQFLYIKYIVYSECSQTKSQ